jgi:glutaredoxin
MAKDFFAAHDVKVEEFDVAADEAKRNIMVEKSGQMGVPVLDIEGEIIVGFDEPKIREVLGISE